MRKLNLVVVKLLTKGFLYNIIQTIVLKQPINAK